MNVHGMERRQLLLALLSLPYARTAFGQRSPMPTSRFTDELLIKLLPQWTPAARATLKDALRPEIGGRIANEGVCSTHGG